MKTVFMTDFSELKKVITVVEKHDNITLVDDNDILEISDLDREPLYKKLMRKTLILYIGNSYNYLNPIEEVCFFDDSL